MSRSLTYLNFQRRSLHQLERGRNKVFAMKLKPSLGGCEVVVVRKEGKINKRTSVCLSTRDE